MRLCSLPLVFAALAMCQTSTPSGDIEVLLQVNRSQVLDMPGGMRRISVAGSDIVEAVAVSPVELLVNGKAPGETSLVAWDLQGSRHTYLIRVLSDQKLLAAVQGNIAREIGPDVTLSVDGPMAVLKGTAPTTTAADRAAAIAAAIPGVKVVNLLRVTVPGAQPQIMLKVRFANYDRSQAQQFGFNLFGLDQKGVGTSSTQQFGQPPNITALQRNATATLADYLNIFYFRPDLNLGAVLRDLASHNIIQILAEPDLLATSGHQASFLAGGEFPFPTIQGGGAGVGQITVQFKEFGIRLNFLPTVTPRGTIHLNVTPEVSSLDYANGLTVNGFTIPGLATKRVSTDVELDNGQSFAIAGLLDNQVTENLDKIPGFASIPVLGKLFTSRSLSRSSAELLIVVTPELVRPLPAGDKGPSLSMPEKFLPGAIPDRLSNPPVPNAVPKTATLTIEELKALLQVEAAQNSAAPQVSRVPSNEFK